MSLYLIFRVVCFFVALNIGILEGSSQYIAVCNINYNYRTAQYTCMDVGGSGTLLTLATFNLHKEWITHEVKMRSQKGQKFWIEKTQGLLRQDTSSSSCNTKVDECPYIEMKKGELICNESNCNHSHAFLCETDSTFNITNCCFRPLMNSSTQSYVQENTTLFCSNDVITSITAQPGSTVGGNNLLLYPVVISLTLSVMFLLSTIPVALKRHWARRKRRCRKQLMMNGNGYHEIPIDYSQAKCVDETPSKCMTYTSISRLKEITPVDTTNVYSTFSVQNSVYNKLKRSRKRSRKNGNSDKSISSSLNANKRTDQNFEGTGRNAPAKGMNDAVVRLEKRKGDVFVNGTSSSQNTEYCLAKVILKDSEESKIVLKDTMLRRTIRKSSSLPSVTLLSAEDHNIVRCAHNHNNMRSQSCEIFDYEMARFAPIIDNRSQSNEKCFTENVDYEMAIFVPINDDKKQLSEFFSTENVDYEITRELHNIRQFSEAKSSVNSAYQMIRKTSMCNNESPTCEIIQNTENLQTLSTDTKDGTKGQDPS